MIYHNFLLNILFDITHQKFYGNEMFFLLKKRQKFLLKYYKNILQIIYYN